MLRGIGDRVRAIAAEVLQTGGAVPREGAEPRPTDGLRAPLASARSQSRSDSERNGHGPGAAADHAAPEPVDDSPGDAAGRVAGVLPQAARHRLEGHIKLGHGEDKPEPDILHNRPDPTLARLRPPAAVRTQLLACGPPPGAALFFARYGVQSLHADFAAISQ